MLNGNLDPNLKELVERVDAQLADAVPIGNSSPERRCFRLLFEDGRVLKGRVLESSADALRVDELLSYLTDARFPSIIGRSGRALLLEWIDGRIIAPGDLSPEFMATCGELLASVHGVSIPADLRWTHPTARPYSMKRLEQDLEGVAALGGLTREETSRLVDIAQSQVPSTVELGLVHWDFCPDNLVIGAKGAPTSIDNATLYVGPLHADLARSWYRWPLHRPQMQAFLTGYRLRGGTDGLAAHFGYWAIRAVLDSALWRLKTGTRELPEPIAAFRRLLSPDVLPFGPGR